MLRHHRSSQILLIALFLGMLWLPLLMSMLQLGVQSESSFKYFALREPQAYPQAPHSLNEVSTYPAMFENAFNDHFPFREQFLKAYGKLCVLGLGTAPRSQLLVGRNGHCFLASHRDDRSCSAALSTIQIDEEKLPYEVAQVEDYARFLERLPMPSVMLSIPTSHVLSFENLPEFIQLQADPEAIQAPQCIQVMRGVSQSLRDRFLLCPFERIREQNAEYPLYAEKHFHWHEGRYTWLTASSIAEHFGVAKYETPRAEEFRYDSLISDLNQFASYEMISENAEVYRPDIWTDLGITDQQVNEIYPNLPPMEYTWYTVNPRGKGCILVAGESFTPMLRRDLARYFKEVISVNYNMARQDPEIQKWLKTVLTDVRPDCAVFLHHERFYLYQDFLADYQAIEATISPPLQMASDPDSPVATN